MIAVKCAITYLNYCFVWSAPVPPTVFTSPSDSCNTIAKRPVAFIVEASGDEPLEYQWQHNTLTEEEDWKPLVPDAKSYEGADTPTLIFPSVGRSDEGKYRCRVSNKAGGVVSNSAALSIGKMIVYSSRSFNKM